MGGLRGIGGRLWGEGNTVKMGVGGGGMVKMGGWERREGVY